MLKRLFPCITRLNCPNDNAEIFYMYIQRLFIYIIKMFCNSSFLHFGKGGLIPNPIIQTIKGMFTNLFLWAYSTINNHMYVILQGTLLVLIAHVICYYFWKTRFYWLAKLHRKDNKAIRKLLSFSKIDRMGKCGLSIYLKFINWIIIWDAIFISIYFVDVFSMKVVK